MDTTLQLLTANDLWKLPKDGNRHELVRGELQTMPPAGGEHGVTTNRLNIPLGHYVQTHDLGEVLAAETGFIVERDPDTVRAPDIAFIRKSRIPATGIPRGFVPFAPDLAVEVVSPGDTAEEVEDKVGEWLAGGAAMVWVVHPRRRTVKVYRSPTAVTILTDQDELDGQDVVPGFRHPVARIFP